MLQAAGSGTAAAEKFAPAEARKSFSCRVAPDPVMAASGVTPENEKPRSPSRRWVEGITAEARVTVPPVSEKESAKPPDDPPTDSQPSVKVPLSRLAPVEKVAP